MAQLFKNNAAGAIYGSISDADTTITLATGHGARFPSVGSDYFLATLIGVDGNGAENAWEIVKVTARSNDVLTVVRAQEGTTAAIWASGTRIEARATAATFGSFLVATGVTPGTYSKLTVLASGLISAGAQLASGDITTALGFTPENAANKNVANGYVGLDSNTLIPSVYLPSYVDDVIEVADFASLPGTGETGKIYVLATPYTSGGITSSQFRWSGSAYAAIVASPGTTDAVTEGASNLYFTTARARTSVSATGSLSYDNTTGVFSYTTPSNISTFTNDVGYITSTALNGYITAATVAATYLPLVGGSISGDVTFTGIGARIKGDFSNATVSSRAMLQTSTTNGTTYIGILPNGTGVNAQLHVFGASDPTNAPYGGLVIDASSVRLFSGALGSGTALPLTFYMGATEYARLSTGGNWLLGTTTDDGVNKLQVNGSVSVTSLQGIIGNVTPAAGTFTALTSTTSTTLASEAVALTANNLPVVRPTLLIDFANSKTVDPRITFTRASTATRVNANGLIESVASGSPRIDYDPVTLACKGLLIEESRTNLLTYSEQFDNAAWDKSGATISANAATAPDGTVTADKLVESSANSLHFIYQHYVKAASPVTYTATIFVKAAERASCTFGIYGGSSGRSTADFNLSTGTVSATTNTSGFTASSATIQQVAEGHYRCIVTATTNSDASVDIQLNLLSSGNSTYTGDGTSGLYIWGAQLEAGAFATSYIPTTSAQVTRAADAASMTGTNFSSWYRQDEGTFLSLCSTPNASIPAGTNHGVFAVSDGTSANDIKVFKASGTASYVSYIDNASSIVYFSSGYTVTAGQQVVNAFAYKFNDSASSFNGSTASTDTSCAIPAVDRLRIGDIHHTGGWHLNGHIARIAYYPVRLGNAQLQAMSTL